MSRRVTVPLDGSRFAEFAIPYARLLAGPDAELDLVSVVEAPAAVGFPGYEEVAGRMLDEYYEHLGERLRAAGVTARRTTLSGAPGKQILGHVDKSESDLIVMATHGRGALSRIWLGSVADALVRRADVPLLLVRPHEEDAPSVQPAPSPRSLLVPLDGSDLAEKTLPALVDLGLVDGVELHLLRAVTFPHSVASPYLPHTLMEHGPMVEEERRQAETYLTEYSETLRARGINVKPAVRMADLLPRVILDQATDLGVDWIAMTSHGRGGVERMLLGSVADKVIRGASCPVLVVRGEHSDD